MGFTFYADPQELVKERSAQFRSLGAPPDVLDRVTPRLKDLWSNAPGGWPYEWSEAARVVQEAGDQLTASVLFGIAKYPCLGNAAHEIAYARQLRSYLAASQGFELEFERRMLAVQYRGMPVTVPVHLLLSPLGEQAPVVLMLGGVDTWKMDIHRSAVGLAKAMQAHVALVDMAGVGETRVPNAPDADTLLAGAVHQLRSIGNGRVAGFGFSFGALWTTKLALTGAVDVAVAVGGPVSGAYRAESLQNIPNGMPGILANSLYRSRAFADVGQMVFAMGGFDLAAQGLLGEGTRGWGDDAIPLLVVNGADDAYVPPGDVTLFEGRPNTVTRLVPDAAHCAAEKMGELMPWILAWLEGQPAMERTARERPASR